MKIIRFILFLAIIAVFLTPTQSTVQAGDPPPQTHFQTEPERPLGANPQPINLEQKAANFNTPALVTPMIDPVSGMLSVAVNPESGERNSASVHGSTSSGLDFFAVAYQENDDIYVAVIDSISGAIWSIGVSDGASKSHNPDIAYESSTELLVVTWQYNYHGDGTDYDVYARALSPTYSGPPIVKGPIMVVVESSWHEWDPSIECNYYDSTCLVVYGIDNSTDFRRIDGRFLDITSDGISATSPSNFAISTLNNEEKPYLAFSLDDASFIVVYTWPAAGGGEKFPVYSMVHSTYQTSGNQYWTNSRYGVDPDTFTTDYDKFATGVAYDNCIQHFVIAFTYDFNGDGSDFDVYGSIINSIGYLWDIFPIANSYASEMSADISFISDPTYGWANPHPDKLVVAYQRSGYSTTNGIIATELRGNCFSQNPIYETDFPNEHYVIKESSPPGLTLESPSITGGNSDTKFFVSFTNNTTETTINADILGKILISQSFADLKISGFAETLPVEVNQSFSYQILVHNNGPDSALNLIFTNTLPENVTFQNAGGTGWYCSHDAGVVNCTRSFLQAGYGEWITIDVSAPSIGGTIENIAEVHGAYSYDLVSTNNSLVIATEIDAYADLEISKSASQNPVAIGGNVTYNLSVKNNGPHIAHDIVVTDTLPAGVSYQNAYGSGWGCNHSSGTVTCTRDTLVVGTAPNITLVVKAPNTSGTIQNTVSVSAASTDSNTTKNQAVCSVSVIGWSTYLPLLSK